MKKYSQPLCTTISLTTAISMLAGSYNRVSDSGTEATTSGESGTGGASGAHAKWWGLSEEEVDEEQL